MSNELRKYGSTSVVQTSNIGFTSEVSDYLVVHTGPYQCLAGYGGVVWPDSLSEWFVDGGRTAVDVLLSDCQYRKGTVLYGRCGVWNRGDSPEALGTSDTIQPSSRRLEFPSDEQEEEDISALKMCTPVANLPVA